MLASLLISALATTAHALPHLGARQTTDPYAGIAGGRATLPGPFTLAALNTTLPNANSTGAPLVLGSGGAITGAAFYILSVRLQPGWCCFGSCAKAGCFVDICVVPV